MHTALNKLVDDLKNEYDVIITSASFEERSLSIFNHIKNSIKFEYKLVSVSVPHYEFIKDNLKTFTDNGFKIIEINTSKQSTSVFNIFKALSEILQIKPDASFVIDITTFTRQTLLILLGLLRNNLSKQNNITFLYSPAKDYAVDLPVEKKWLTKGVLSVDSVFGYLGTIRPSHPYHLIILMGYEVERASSLISAYEPSKISIGYANKEDSISPELYEVNRLKFNDLLAEYPNAESFEFSCTKILDCKNQILEQASKYANHNVVISPMNNKISTICCSLAAHTNKGIQLAIALPAIYKFKNYSEPSDLCFMFELPELIKKSL